MNTIQRLLILTLNANQAHLLLVAVIGVCHLASSHPCCAQETKSDFIGFEFLNANEATLFQLIANPVVAEEIGVSQDQQTRGYRLFTDMRRTISDQTATLTLPPVSRKAFDSMSPTEMAKFKQQQKEIIEKRQKIESEIHEQYHEQFFEVLYPAQRDRLAELVLQSHLNRGIVFAEYDNQQIAELTDISNEEKETLQDAAESARAEFLTKVNELYRKHHLKIRESLDADSLEKIERVFGEPLELKPEDIYPTARVRK